jgi:16S rRNA (guanine527-N7)-methyltransferase
MPPLPEMTAQWQQTLNWQPTAAQAAQFQLLYDLILAGNAQLNLTRITALEEFWEKHLWDSLRGIARFLPQPADLADPHEVPPPNPTFFHPDSPTPPLPHQPFRAIDIGTGAGFPGIPMAIVQPTWKVTLLDSTRKKMQFLEGVLESLGLDNARTWVDRVESLGHDLHHRQRYDLAVVRAVAGATVGAEYALPLVKLGGLVVLYRGQWTAAEETALNWAVQELGGTIEAIEGFKIPLTEGERHCLYLRKVASTPADYPRMIGIPTQKPLTRPETLD